MGATGKRLAMVNCSARRTVQPSKPGPVNASSARREVHWKTTRSGRASSTARTPSTPSLAWVVFQVRTRRVGPPGGAAPPGGTKPMIGKSQSSAPAPRGQRSARRPGRSAAGRRASPGSSQPWRGR